MTDDPGPEFWARQQVQLEVINALRRWIDAHPDRFTGLTTNGSSHVVVHVVDPAGAEQKRFRALLQDARRRGIEVQLARGSRPLRMLNGIMDGIVRGEVFAEAGVHLVSCGIDVATATVQVTVAARAVEEARRACARFTGAVVVTAVDRSQFDRLPGNSGPHDDWPVPTVAPETTIGQSVAAVADRYRAEGFQVEIVDPDRHAAVTMDLRPGRIRLLVHDDVIVDATQG